MRFHFCMCNLVLARTTCAMYNYNSILFTFYLFYKVRRKKKSKKSNVTDVSCAAILSGQMV